MRPAPLDLGPFRLTYPAGRGATARVWHAVHRATDTPVAVKVLTAIAPADHERRRLFVREVRAVARLDHPAIIRVHDYGEIPAALAALAGDALPAQAPFVVMDWHDRGTLGDRRGQMRFAEVRATLLTLLDALAHAHARGVVHRDLKPANVLLGADGPVLSDFGLAITAESASDSDGRVSGTPNYMAPEQVSDDWRSLAPATDLYALGCLAWCLVTGEAPFAGRGVEQVMRSHLGAPLPSLRLACGIPVVFDGWLRRLLAKAPMARFTFAADAAVALMAMPENPGSGDDWITPHGLRADKKPSTDAIAGNHATIAGPATLDDEATVLAPPVFVALSETAWAHGPGPDGRPPLPAEWRRPDVPWAPWLPGCGRALAELRELRLRGREPERARLWALLGEVVEQRQPRVVVVDGPSGIGKTRLVTWLARRAHELGQADALVITHAPAPGPAHGLAPIFNRRLRLDGLAPEDAGARVRRALGVDAPLAAALVALARPDLRAAIDGFRITLSGEGEIVVTVLDGLAALAAGRPLVVQVDDAQWGDRALRLVHQALDRADLPVLFAVTVRHDTPIARATRRLIDALVARPGAVHLALAPLDAQSQGDSSTARLPLAPSTLDQLVRVTGGNPLFSSELLRHWLHTDALEETPAGYRLVLERASALPPTLTALLRTRLDSLLDGVRPDPLPALELAAVLGVVVDESEWGAAREQAGLDRPDEAVERLLDAGFILAGERPGFAFAHTLLRDALETRARDAGRLERWHLAAAAGLLVLGERCGAPVDPVRRAMHLSAAGLPAVALPCWRAAIDAAENAWGALTEADAPLLFEAVRAARGAGLGLLDAVWVEFAISWSAHQNSRRRGLGLRHARHALDRARRLREPALEARALRQLARCLRDRNDLEGADALLAESEALCVANGDVLSLGATRYVRAIVAFLRGDLDASERLLHRQLRRLEAPDVPMSAVRRAQQVSACNQLGEIARRRGDLGAAERAYLRALGVLGDDDTYLPALVALNLALIDLDRDDIRRAEERAQTARTRLLRAGNARYRIYAEAVLLACAGERGDAAGWDRAWQGLAPVTALDFVYLDVARLLARAAVAAESALPARAAAAREVARRQYRALGLEGDAAALG